MNFIRVAALLLEAGFTSEQAWSLALSGPSTVFLVPLPTLDPA